MKRYINAHTVYGIETFDELSTEDFDSISAFRAELKRLLSNYRMAHNDYVYVSQRSTKEWKERL